MEVWCDLQCKFARALLFLFNLSHVILVTHPTATFDVSYIYLFRTLDVIRQKSIPLLADQLRSFPVSGDWIQAGRPCSPRVIFVFQSQPLEAKPDLGTPGDLYHRSKVKKFPPIKRLEHALGDQIYKILRKSRVITNISGNSLFAIPANQEFVYVCTSESIAADPVGFLLTQLKDHCSLSKESDGSLTRSKSYALNRRGSTQSPTSTVQGSARMPTLPRDGTGDHSFSTFLWKHIDLALTKGFDDNVGRHPIPAYFEIPTIKTWFLVAAKLKAWFFDAPQDTKTRGIMSSLKTALDIDVRFSEGRCGKVLPLASAAYQENLPSHYSTEYHQRKLAQAMQVFVMHARGPAFSRYAQQLQEDCERLWKSGHQMCEVLSLTGNHCINPLHRLPDTVEDERSKPLPIMPHFSQVKLVSTCDCGSQQASREDPFDVKAANHDFYATIRDSCCTKLERISFPVFQPSTPEAQPAAVPRTHVQHPTSDVEDWEKDDAVGEGERSDPVPAINLGLSAGQSETSDTFADEPTPQLSQGERDDTPAEEGDDEVVISIGDSSDVPSSSKEKHLVRQPSTTEYLPGMLHLESPPGLLPKFSSWSLVCLGPSSLYSHNIGIQDQPGLIPGTNFLLPWDVTVRLETKDRWPAVGDNKRPPIWKGKKGGKDGSQFNVKIFIGVEYECARGHRFMCSGPDRVLRATGSGLVRDNANKVTGSDMPLYFPCPCRSSKQLMAQLMRIHVVTPKAPIHVTLNPKVQPAAPPSPVFYPGNTEPVRLTQSAYWVLRLPFVYQGDQSPYLPPKEPVPLINAHLCKGAYGIAEHVPER